MCNETLLRRIMWTTVVWSDNSVCAIFKDKDNIKKAWKEEIVDDKDWV